MPQLETSFGVIIWARWDMLFTIHVVDDLPEQRDATFDRLYEEASREGQPLHRYADPQMEYVGMEWGQEGGMPALSYRYLPKASYIVEEANVVEAKYEFVG